MGNIDFTIQANWQLINESHLLSNTDNKILPIYIPIPLLSAYFKVFVPPPNDPKAVNWFRGGWFKLYSGNASVFGGSPGSAAINFYSVLLGEWKILHFPLINSRQFFLEYQCPYWFSSVDVYVYQYMLEDDIIPEL